MEEPIVVVGAGISGVACARAVAAAGLEVRLVNRGRRIGGRMASRRIGGRPVDLGASYFTVSDPAFAAVAGDWEGRGLAHRWTDTLSVLTPGAAPRATTGPVRWGAAGGLRTLVEDLAQGLEVEQDTVEQVSLSPDGGCFVDGRAVGAVVLAMPDAQARRLLEPGHGVPLDRDSEPVLALVARYAERGWDLDGAFVNDDPVLAWVADDGSRRGDGAAVLVAHSTPGFAAAHLDEPDSGAPEMLAALHRLTGIGSEPEDTLVHRWSLARPTGRREAPYYLDDTGLGVCGDGWGPVSKVEGAFLSGQALGEALATRLGG